MPFDNEESATSASLNCSSLRKSQTLLSTTISLIFLELEILNEIKSLNIGYEISVF
jgi:hypothetical protein